AVGITLCFAFVNGFHDGGNVVATIIGSRSMRPGRALLLATLAEFVGPLIIGTAVANTIASSILKPEALAGLPQPVACLVVISAALGAILWKLPTWFLGLPSSSSHAIISGLVGAGLVAVGSHGIAFSGVLGSVLLPLLVSPIVGIVLGYIIFAIIRTMFASAHRSAGHFFITVQKPIMLLLAAGHGSNDAQKSMGLIALTLAASGGQFQSKVGLPEWVVLSAAAALAAGVAAGGLRIVKSVGYDMFRMEPVHSFASLFTSTSVVIGASVLGGPISTAQVVGASVMGVGASRRLAGVRWHSARSMGYAWFMTVPFCGGMSAVLFWVLNQIFG
ncbi:anion permease, partial [Thermodesulfobacteriota bacterium]